MLELSPHKARQSLLDQSFATDEDLRRNQGMRLTRAGLLLAIVMLGAATFAAAQSTGGTIRGHVTDGGGLAVPGATVTVVSPNLQGERVTVTSSNGD